MKTVFVTGVHGFIGRHLTGVLATDDWCIRPVPHVCVPVFDKEDVTDRTAVIHLATNYGRGRDSMSEMLADNTLFPLRLLEETIKHRIPLFINTDTAFTIDYPYQRPYTVSKKHFAKWGEVCCAGSETRFVNLKLHYVYGPGDSPLKFIPSIIKKCLDGDIVETTPGEQKKDFTHVYDVVAAFQCILDAYGSSSVDDSFVNLDCGSGQAVSVRDAIMMIHRLTESKSKVVFGALPYRANEEMFDQADNTLLNIEGWSPKFMLEAGLRSTIDDMQMTQTGVR